jgi:hypothetical protein
MYSIFCFVKAMFPISILNESLCHISFFYLQSSLHSTCTRHPALAFLKIKEGAPVLRRFAAGLLSHRGCSTFKIKDISPSGAPPSGLISLYRQSKKPKKLLYIYLNTFYGSMAAT